MLDEIVISERVKELAHKSEEDVKEIFRKLDIDCETNSIKVLNAFNNSL